MSEKEKKEMPDMDQVRKAMQERGDKQLRYNDGTNLYKSFRGFPNPPEADEWLARVKDLLNEDALTNIVPTGFQELQDRINQNGGFKRGELTVIAGLCGYNSQFQKTDMYLHLCLNEMRDAEKEGRKPRFTYQPRQDAYGELEGYNIEERFKEAMKSINIDSYSEFDFSSNRKVMFGDHLQLPLYAKGWASASSKYVDKALPKIVAPVSSDSRYGHRDGQSYDYFKQEWKAKRYLTNYSYINNLTFPIETVIDAHYQHGVSRSEVEYYNWRRHHLTYSAKLVGIEDRPLLSMLFH